MMKSSKVTLLQCKAIEDDYYMFTSTLDSVDEEMDFTRMFFFSRKNSWRHVDLPNFVAVDLCVIRSAMGSQRKYAVISEHGEIKFYWPGGEAAEKIIDAGLKSSGPIFGYINAIKEINGVIYACGGGGQIYERRTHGWVDIAKKLRKAAPIPQSNLALNPIEVGDDISDIDGYSPRDLYASGMNGLYHYDGDAWKECDVSTNEILTSVFCAPDNVVWACGYNGAILRGNVIDGFIDISNYDDNMTLKKCLVFEGRIYFASNEGLFVTDIESKKRKLSKVDFLNECVDISASDGCLVCIGEKKISLFKSGIWSELSHPDN